jgi:hypothetical protein
MFVSQQCGPTLVNFTYSRILTFQYFKDDSYGKLYLKWSVELVITFAHRLPEDGTLVPKHAGVKTYH